MTREGTGESLSVTRQPLGYEVIDSASREHITATDLFPAYSPVVNYIICLCTNEPETKMSLIFS